MAFEFVFVCLFLWLACITLQNCIPFSENRPCPGLRWTGLVCCLLFDGHIKQPTVCSSHVPQHSSLVVEFLLGQGFLKNVVQTETTPFPPVLGPAVTPLLSLPSVLLLFLPLVHPALPLLTAETANIDCFVLRPNCCFRESSPAIVSLAQPCAWTTVAATALPRASPCLCHWTDW